MPTDLGRVSVRVPARFVPTVAHLPRIAPQNTIVLRIRGSADINVSSDRVWHATRPVLVEAPLPKVSSRVMVIDGSLPYGRRLRGPMVVVLEDDGEEVLVSEPLFNMHAGGPTEKKAIKAFRRILSGYIDVLERRESKLGPAPKAQLAYLRSLIVTD